MAKNLFSQYVNSWVRQMGRESAYTAYGTITGKNTVRDLSEFKAIKTFPRFNDYVKLLLAQFLPLLGPIWAIVKGLSRLLGNTVFFYGIADQNIYSLDRRYSNGRRYVGTKEVKIKIQKLKSECSAKEISAFHSHAIAYTIIGIISLALEAAIFYNIQEEKEAHQMQIEQYTVWQTVKETDDFLGKSKEYEMLYSKVDSLANEEVVLLKENGAYFLMARNTTCIKIHGTRTYDFDLKTKTKIKSCTLTSNPSKQYNTPSGETVNWELIFPLPTDMIPKSGELLVRCHDIIYTFDFD